MFKKEKKGLNSKFWAIFLDFQRGNYNANVNRRKLILCKKKLSKWLSVVLFSAKSRLWC